MVLVGEMIQEDHCPPVFCGITGDRDTDVDD